MKKLLLCLLCGFALRMSASAAAPSDPWPTVQDQLTRDKVVPGSPLEVLIRDNQELGMLRAEELKDRIPVPLWLRVWWRKAHPETSYLADDPTGGYPHVLREIHEWMITHQDLKPGLPKVGYGAGLDVLTDAATAGLNLRMSGAQAAPRSESDIRVNYWDTQKIVSASNNIGGTGRQGQYWSTDGGSTWGQTELPLASGDAFHSDPTVDWTSDGTAWSTTIGINSSQTSLRMQAYKSTNNGATWTWDATFSGSQTSADKQIMWVDHSATSPYANTIYVCWHNGAPQFVNRRTASGWGTPLQISGAETTGTAIGCDVKTNSNGDAFVFWPATGNRRILVAKSTNGGVSFGTPVIVTTALDSYDIGVPSFNMRRALIYVSGGAYRTGTQNMVYASWTDLAGGTGCSSAANEPGSNVASTCRTRIWFARSTDGGASWGTPQAINPSASLNDQFNQWMVVDETSGKIGIIYYDTIADPGRKKTNVYYQSSTDDGASWSAPLLVTTAATDETTAGSDSGNQYGDYNSLSGYAGSFWPSWTDRRSNAREEIWTANVLDGATPCTPPAPPAFVSAAAASASQVNLTWSAVSGATEYRVLRGTASGGPFTQVGSTTNLWFNDTTAACATTYYYVVQSFATCASESSTQVSATTAACQTCQAQSLYSNNFETGTGLSNWSVGTFVAGGSTADWRGIQTCTAASGTKVFRFGGSTCTGNYANNDFIYAQPNGSGGIAVPAGTTDTRLSFSHRRSFEADFDGGSLAVSLDGTNYVLVPSSAIVSGTGYSGTIGDECPPTGTSGMEVFTGSATSFSNTTVDLDTACDLASGGSDGCAGKSVRVAFTSVTDCTVTDDGWYLDDVQVTACPAPPPPSGLDFHTVAPCRLIDTRLAAGHLGGPSLVPSSQRSFLLAGTCGVPVTAGALAVNVTVIGATANGNLSLFPADETAPVTSTINFLAGVNRANNAILPLSPTGAITVKANTMGAVDFTLDVVGYFE